MRAKLRARITLALRNRGSMAACSRELPSPMFSSPMATQPMPASWRRLAISGNGRVSPSIGSFPVPASPV